jgi:5-formyltetrahydrofolate cyclo-ligase
MEYISKSLLRKTILQYRRLLDQSVYEQRNNLLLKNLQRVIEEEDAKTIHTFLPMKRNNEVNVEPLFAGWWKGGRKIAVSKTDFRTREMNHFILEKKTKLIENSMGIPEPIDGDQVDFTKADLILIPLLVCDRHRNRIGYGGGFYDQLLLETNATKVGLSLSPPLDSILQKEEWDVPLDYIISYK